MLLKNLIKKSPQNLQKLKITGLALNSKDVRKGFIFFALKGSRSNGEHFINQAIKKRAALIICSKSCKVQSKKVNIIKTKNVRSYLSEVTPKFYKLKPKNIIAVTGTNGKTSVADYFYQILEDNHIPVASIGTLGIRYKKKCTKTNLTSPDIITLHKNLEKLKKNKIDHVIIEASSHGLDQNRLDNLKFKAGIFTNFSQDHLDYHKTMKAYLNSKLILFSKLLPKKSYVISDKHIKHYPKIKKISQNRKLRLLDINKHVDQVKNISKSLIGIFQIKNLSMAILAAQVCKINKAKINSSIKKIKNVNGRLDLIKKYSNNVKIFIDYAHTPDALEEVLKSIKNAYNNDITLVFGCGGERDVKKRALMAKVAKFYCQKIYVTDDNPRKENPESIRQEIIKNLKGSKYFNIGNRANAIKEAISNAQDSETILIAGKGHENYQDYGDKIISISDKQIVKKLKIVKRLNPKKQNYLFNSKILKKIIKKKKIYKFEGLAIDSRDIKKDNLFLAIKGKKNDGNQFISKAIKKGANYIISSKNNKNYKKRIIKVNNSITFLKQFGKLKRDNCNAKILAITGSSGKTTLKNMLNILLKKYGKTYASPRSFNNHYGVPVSLSNLNSSHKFGVFEVGMSKAGEINKLSQMIKPNLAIITNIAEAHIENFDNIKGIAKAKSEIIRNIQDNGSLILNRDDRFFNYLSKKAKLRKIKVITFGKSKKSDVYLVKTKKLGTIKKVIVNVKDEILELKIENINIYNVLASLAVLKLLDLDIKKIVKIFENFLPSDGRGKFHKIRRYKKNFVLVDESYNANPFSVKNALVNFSEIRKNKNKKYLLLGDMLELGEKSEAYHKDLSQLINSSDIDKVFIKGEKTLITFKSLKKEKRGNILQCSEDVDFILKNIIANNDYLMIKGSNATGLNNISKKMIKGI